MNYHSATLICKQGFKKDYKITNSTGGSVDIQFI